MQIKNLFDDLKRIGKKEYYFKNGDEELYFANRNIVIEIANTNDRIDLVISEQGKRSNYLHSSFFNENQKKQIQTIINSYDPMTLKSESICRILIDVFLK